MFTAYLPAVTMAAPATAIDRQLWFTSNDYPTEALKKGAQGSVSFEVKVDATGKPTECSIQKSSGDSTLDQATCNIVLARARFKPGLDSTGTPAPGTYSTSVVWMLPSGGPPPTFHHAVIMDFTDPDHPVCKVESTLPRAQGLPTCDHMLGQGLGVRFVKAVYLIATSAGDQTPYRGEATWGERISFLANEQYHSKTAAMPFACISIAAQGEVAGKDACGTFPGRHTVTEAEKKDAVVLRSELSMFGVLRPRQSRSNGCKNGESAAESLGCE